MKQYGNQQILQWLYDNHHTIRWLSDETNIPYRTILRKISNRTEWKSTEIDSVLIVTGRTYEELFFRKGSTK